MKNEVLSLLWSRRWHCTLSLFCHTHTAVSYISYHLYMCEQKTGGCMCMRHACVIRQWKICARVFYFTCVREHGNLMFMNIISESLLLLLPASVTLGQKLWIRSHIFHHICAWSEGSQWDLQLNWCISFQASSGLPDTSVNWNRRGPCSPTNGPSVCDARKHTQASERYPFMENIFPCSLLREIF